MNPLPTVLKPKKLLLTLSLTSSLLLSGCVVPGMHMKTHDFTPVVNSQNQIVTPKITPITAQLVQKLNQQDKIQQALASKNYQTPQGFTTNATGYNYHIGPQDVLQVIVWNQPQFNMGSGDAQSTLSASTTTSSASNAFNTRQAGIIVDSQGNIYYPYAGEMHVGGLTPNQARDTIAKKLSQFIKNPQVSVQVIGFHSQKVEVTGAVKQSSVIPITNVPLTVLDAVTQSGGPVVCGVSSSNSGGGAQNLCADLQHVTITRGNKTITVDLNNLKNADGQSDNWILQNGDVVHVPNNNQYRIFVLGDVLKPGPYNMVDSHMTLKEAIGNALGIQVGADPRYTYVIRNFENKPQIFSLNLRSPDALSLAGEFQLDPEDVVFVSTSTMQTFNEVLGQITPTLQTAVYTKSLLN